MNKSFFNMVYYLATAEYFQYLELIFDDIKKSKRSLPKFLFLIVNN